MPDGAEDGPEEQGDAHGGDQGEEVELGVQLLADVAGNVALL